MKLTPLSADGGVLFAQFRHMAFVMTESICRLFDTM